MKSLPNLVVLLLGASSFTAVVAAEPASLCQELAKHVRQLAPTDTEKALSTGLVIAQPEPPDRWGPREKAMNARLRKALETKGALSEEGPGSVMELEHLPDTSVYMGSVVAGTAECQTAAFATLTPDGVGRPARASWLYGRLLEHAGQSRQSARPSGVRGKWDGEFDLR